MLVDGEAHKIQDRRWKMDDITRCTGDLRAQTGEYIEITGGYVPGTYEYTHRHWAALLDWRRGDKEDGV